MALETRVRDMLRFYSTTLSFIISLAFTHSLLAAPTKATNTESTLTGELLRLRDSLPDKALTIDLVVSRALQKSNSFQQVYSEVYKIPAPALQAEAAFDTRIEVSQQWLSNENETNPPSPQKTEGNGTLLQLSRYFSTGTAIKAELSRNYVRPEFAAGSPFTFPANYETKAAFSLSQNLWADSLGYASRRALKAARLATEAQKYQFQAGVEAWTLNMVNTFYFAWYSQAQALAARDNFKRQERLLKVAKVRLNRGTFETPDYLQVQSSFLQAKTQAAEANNNLENHWRQLIVLLKLPGDWMLVDAASVPIKIDNVDTAASDICQKFREKGLPESKPPSLTAAEYLAESANLNYEKARSERWPELKLVGSYFINALDANAEESTSQAFAQDYPGWSVGLTLALPLEFSAQKAKIGTAHADKLRAEALKSDAKDDQSLSWLNECANLERLTTAVKDAEQAFKNQSRRALLEEQRFKLGRSSTLNVIQASGDATQAEVFLRATEVKIRQSAWKILELNTEILSQLKSFTKKHGGEFPLENL